MTAYTAWPRITILPILVLHLAKHVQFCVKSRLTCICATRNNYHSVCHNYRLPIFIAKTVVLSSIIRFSVFVNDTLLPRGKLRLVPDIYKEKQKKYGYYSIHVLVLDNFNENRALYNTTTKIDMFAKQDAS